MREIKNLINLFKCIIEDAKIGFKNLKDMQEKRKKSIDNNKKSRDDRNER